MNSIIGITMGDPAGIGPEVIVKALVALNFKRPFIPVIIGNIEIIKETAKKLDLDLRISSFNDLKEITHGKCDLWVYDMEWLTGKKLEYGIINKGCGEIAFRCVTKAVELALSGYIDAIVTAPVCKEAWHKAGHFFDGHTGLLAKLTDTRDYRMMFSSDKLTVILSTTHLSLQKACSQLTTDQVFTTIETGFKYLKSMNILSPRIAVCGLNPHAGENGLFGNEETIIIKPAIAKAKNKGIRVEGPFPADTIFLRALKGEFDLIVAQYHDQGLIPVKLLAFDTAVNITAGLPLIRTSVDHGTAFDIAGKGVAKHENMVKAIEFAIRLITLRSHK